MGVFDDIYERNLWGFGSGHGSLPAVTKELTVNYFKTKDGYMLGYVVA